MLVVNPPGTGPIFQTLTSGRDGSAAQGVSADGSVVVGCLGFMPGPAFVCLEAFRWTAATGIVKLGVLPGLQASNAAAVSADGNTVVGTSFKYLTICFLDCSEQAFRWTVETGMVGLGTLPGLGKSFAKAVSADGSVVVGTAQNDGSDSQAFRWTASTDVLSMLRRFIYSFLSRSAARGRTDCKCC